MSTSTPSGSERSHGSWTRRIIAVGLALVLVVPAALALWPAGDPDDPADTPDDAETVLIQRLALPGEVDGWEADRSEEATAFVTGLLASYPLSDESARDSLSAGTYVRADRESSGDVASFTAVAYQPAPSSDEGRLVLGDPEEAAATVAGGTRADAVERLDFGQGGMACGLLEVPTADDAPAEDAEQPVCAAVDGGWVIVLLFAESRLTPAEAGETTAQVASAALDGGR